TTTASKSTDALEHSASSTASCCPVAVATLPMRSASKVQRACPSSSACCNARKAPISTPGATRTATRSVAMPCPLPLPFSIDRADAVPEERGLAEMVVEFAGAAPRALRLQAVCVRLFLLAAAVHAHLRAGGQRAGFIRHRARRDGHRVRTAALERMHGTHRA